MTKNCTYAYWLTLNRRARNPAIRAYALRRKPYLCERPAPWIGESETRDELIAKARNLLRGIRKYGPHADSVREIRGILSDVNGSESAFASFGTCSLPTEDARPGCLNHLLPEIA